MASDHLPKSESSHRDMAITPSIAAISSSRMRRTLRSERRAYRRYERDFYYEHYFNVKLPLATYLPSIIFWLVLALVFRSILGLLVAQAYANVVLEFWAAYLLISLLRYAWSRLDFGSGAVRSGSVIASNATYRYEIPERPVDLKNYIEQKPNRNLFICGTSGEGKSFLMRYMLEQVDTRKVVFNFKPNDEYLSMGYGIIDMGKALPNPFKDPEAFVSAFLITFPIASIGITAQYVPIMLRELAETSSSWQEFGAQLRTQIARTKDKIQSSALLYIEEHATALVSQKANVIEMKDEDLVFDFSTLKNEDSKTFYAEIILRGIWKGLSNGQSRDTLICVDEAHRMLHRFEKYESIYAEISRQIRSFGMLWASSQNFTDMADDIRNQFATQFCFNTTHPDDLRALSLADQKLSWAASSMPLHFFTDARYEWLHEAVPEFILHYEPALRPRTYFKGIKPDEAPGKAGGISAIDYEKEIEIALSGDKVEYASRIAKAISQKYDTDLNATKMRVMAALSKMARNYEINRMRLMVDSKSYVVYYNRAQRISALHKWMQNVISAVIRSHGIGVTKEANGGRISEADIETENFDIEIETGYKKNIDDLRSRITKSGKRTVIVVPNSDVAERYLSLSLKNVEVATMSGFEELLVRSLNSGS